MYFFTRGFYLGRFDGNFDTVNGFFFNSDYVKRIINVSKESFMFYRFEIDPIFPTTYYLSIIDIGRLFIFCIIS